MASLALSAFVFDLAHFFLAVKQVLGQQSHRTATGTLLLAGVPGGTGDVQVRPGEFVSETREKTGCGYSTSGTAANVAQRSEEHTSELQSRGHLVCRLLLEKKK